MTKREKNVIARYENLIFSCYYASGYDVWYLQFLEFFEDSDDNFFDKFKSQFPEYKLQVYNHKTKPLNRSIKVEILYLIKQPEMQKNIREFNLNKLL